MDVQLGRFHQVDPMSEIAHNWTPYRYAFNNPLRFIDPSGMTEEESNSTEGESVEDFVMNIFNDAPSGRSDYNSDGECTCGCPGKPPCKEEKEGEKEEQNSQNSSLYNLYSNPWTAYGLTTGIAENYGAPNAKFIFRKNIIPIFNEAGKKIAALVVYGKPGIVALQYTRSGLKVLGPTLAGFDAAANIYFYNLDNENKISGSRLTYRLGSNAAGIISGYLYGGPVGIAVGGALYGAELLYDFKMDQNQRMGENYKLTPSWNKVNSANDLQRLLNPKTWFSGMNLNK